LVAAAQEPPGKNTEQCQKVTVLLTLDTKDDATLCARQGVTGLRRSRILRLATEARDQGGLLRYEDLAYRLLNCGVRTIVRDVAALRRRGLEVPTRGQQQDIGPGCQRWHQPGGISARHARKRSNSRHGHTDKTWTFEPDVGVSWLPT
jgi:hypothetical protein